MSPCHYFISQQGRKKSLKKDRDFLIDKLPITVIIVTLGFFEEKATSALVF